MEVPAGGLSPGLTPEEVARGGLLGEVGGAAAQLHYVGQLQACSGISSEVADVYLATGVDLGKTHHEPLEPMEIRLVPVDEALQLVREAEITDEPSALALTWCEPLLT